MKVWDLSGGGRMRLVQLLLMYGPWLVHGGLRLGDVQSLSLPTCLPVCLPACLLIEYTTYRERLGDSPRHWGHTG